MERRFDSEAGFTIVEVLVAAVILVMGSFATFSVKSVAVVPVTVKRYRLEVMRQLTDIAWGSGAIVVRSTGPGSAETLVSTASSSLP